MHTTGRSASKGRSQVSRTSSMLAAIAASAWGGITQYWTLHPEMPFLLASD